MDSSLDLDLLINTPTGVHEVDMKTGLDTMQGISDAVRTITETIVSKEVPERKTPKNKIRGRLRKRKI